VSVLTSSQLIRIYEQRRNYDLRRLLAGAERLLDSLLDLTEKEPAFLLGAVRCLPLPAATRDVISSTISSTCAKIKVNIGICYKHQSIKYWIMIERSSKRFPLVDVLIANLYNVKCNYL
jgi:hypothetical protein